MKLNTKKLTLTCRSYHRLMVLTHLLLKMSFKITKEKNPTQTVTKRDLKGLRKYRDNSSSYEFFQSKAERSYAKSDHSQTDKNRTRKRLKHSEKRQACLAENTKEDCGLKKRIIKCKKDQEKQRTVESSQHPLKIILDNNKLAVQGNNIESKVPCMMVKTCNNSKTILPLQPARIMVLPLDKDGVLELTKESSTGNVLCTSSIKQAPLPNLKLYSADKGKFVPKDSPIQIQNERKERDIHMENIQALNTPVPTEQHLTLHNSKTIITRLIQNVMQNYCHCYY
ncbi:unnamed protein product [Moneuplotes crassus]|uniref:Uncharacterized protein n=1 Tax=Euplotes crassus TaxID=5936 RepID=A0AAD1Y3X8_EUPCR|nr:unnamed protein product [Moneuplotes crassus]